MAGPTLLQPSAPLNFAQEVSLPRLCLSPPLSYLSPCCLDSTHGGCPRPHEGFWEAGRRQEGEQGIVKEEAPSSSFSCCLPGGPGCPTLAAAARGLCRQGRVWGVAMCHLFPSLLASHSFWPPAKELSWMLWEVTVLGTDKLAEMDCTLAEGLGDSDFVCPCFCIY